LVEGLHLEEPGGAVIGNMYYGFSQRALIPYEVEEAVAILYCEWVQRRHQGQGYSRLLFDALTQRLSAEGTKGILAEASAGEEGLPYGHLLRRGFAPIQQAGPRRLMYYPLARQAITAKPLERRIEEQAQRPVRVLVFSGGFCPCETATSLVAADVAREFGGRVVLEQVPISAESVRTYGVARGVYINGRPVPEDGVPEEAMRHAIRQALEGS
ncbi:MAG: hypothetical protein M8467_20495, partial [Anaerolineae bacterium]|nr:hypothetical protein [Anaerolineae bacterium]